MTSASAKLLTCPACRSQLVIFESDLNEYRCKTCDETGDLVAFEQNATYARFYIPEYGDERLI